MAAINTEPEGTAPTPGAGPDGGSQQESPVEVAPAPIVVVDAPPGGIEREVFGKWSVLLRNLFGATAVWTLCVSAVANAWTTNVSVTEHGIWPSEVSMIVMNVGPIVVAWTWMNANKTLSTLMEFVPLGNRIRSRVASAIAPRDPVPPQDPPTPPQ